GPFGFLICRGRAMQSGDGCFQVILAQFSSHRGFFQEMKSPSNQIPVPFGTVLMFQLDQAAIVIPSSVKTGRVETKEREEGIGLGFSTFRMLAQKKRQADGFQAKVFRRRPIRSAAMVTLVEEKVDGLIDRIHARAYFRSVGDFHESPRAPEQL